MSVPLLSLLIWLPIFGGGLVLLAGRDAVTARRLALALSVAEWLCALPLYGRFDAHSANLQFVEHAPWIEAFNIHYFLGVDGLSMPLILLTALVTPLVVLAGWRVITHRVAQYMAAFLILEGLMIGVFAALDAVLFYVFWEAMLVPMFLIIGVWGGPRRIYATLKFFLYTFFGSVFMLVALIYLHVTSPTGSFSILDFHLQPLTLTEQRWIFLAFLLAFAVKVPMWPVHTWLPDAHVEAPTGGSVVLAAIMLKIGGYGFLRFSLPIAPDASAEFDGLLVALSLTAVVYIGLVALVQEDMKKLIAYSSIAHMGFVTLGFFLPFLLLERGQGLKGAALGMEGGLVQMLSHGFISAALFLCVGVMYDRVHSRLIRDYGGVVNRMPVFSAFLVLFALANAGLPGTSGFVGEFMVTLAAMRADFWIAATAALTLVLGAAYSLWLVKRVVFGAVRHEAVRAMPDVDGREFFILAVLAAAVLLFGIWPDPLVTVMHPAVDQLLQHVAVSKIPG